MEQENKKIKPRLLKKSFSYFYKYWKQVGLSFLFLLVLMGEELILPQLLGESINYIRDAVKNIPMEKLVLWPFVVTYICISTIRAIFARNKGILDSKINSSIVKDMRCKIYDKLQKLSFSYHNNTSAGQIISRVTHDVNVMREYYSTILFIVPEIFIILIGSTVLLLLIHVKLALVALCTCPLTIYMLIIFKGKIRKLWRRVDDLYGDVTTVLQENIAGVRVVKSFAKENYEISKFTSKVDIFLKSFFDAIDYWVKRIPLAQFLFGLSTPLTLWYGGVLVINHQINIGDLTKVLFYLMGFSWRLGRIGNIVNTVETAHAAFERISEIVDIAPEIQDKENACGICLPKGEIVFDNVSFSYREDKDILHDINLKIAPNELIGITGPTGSGKSTLVGLIPRFYDTASGNIFVDGINVQDMQTSALRKSIGIVFQETFLFSAPISENIAYGRPDAEKEEIESFASIAQCADFVEKLDQKYDTLVGERGITLSGGQKQRVSIARASLIKPKIMILDNPSSNLDAEIERLVMEKLMKLGSTIIIISQKISVLRHANRIVVLENGRITGVGTHNELIKKEGFYKEIYQEQINR